MATPKSQRIGIWIITIVMVIGTIGSFLVMVLASQNSAKDQQEYNKQMAEYQKQIDAQKKQQEAEAKKLSAKYYEGFKKYESYPSKFDMNSVGDKVSTKDIEAGSGKATVSDSSTAKIYYVGWNPKGVTFDSSFDGKSLKAPFSVVKGGSIDGMVEGVKGMKVGGVREITIPSDLAYGESGQGDNIPPNTPIKFIVKVIEISE